MIKIISHRGNLEGRLPARENQPLYIDTAMSYGYEVEVDIWSVNGQFRLGHDFPLVAVTTQWVANHTPFIWWHCKNIEAAQSLSSFPQIKMFCHTSDPYVLMTSGFIWQHNIKLPSNHQCIIPLMSEQDLRIYSGRLIYGVCTDYPRLAKELFK